MSLRKFRPKDIITNTMKAHPNCEFLVFDGQVYYNSTPAQSGAISPNVPVSPGHLSLYEVNVDRMSGSHTTIGGPTFDGSVPGTGRFIGGAATPMVVISDNAGDYDLRVAYEAKATSATSYVYSDASAAALVAWWKMFSSSPTNDATGSFGALVLGSVSSPALHTNVPRGPVDPDNGSMPDGFPLDPAYIANESVFFDAADKEYYYVSDTDSLSFGASPITFAAWIYYDRGGVYYPTILHKGNQSGGPSDVEYFFRIRNEDQLQVRLCNSDDGNYIGCYTTDKPDFKDDWWHVAATWDGTTGTSAGLKLYINGTEYATTDDSDGAASSLVCPIRPRI